MWNRLLCFLRLRVDWTDPRNAPPFTSEVPHPFVMHAFDDAALNLAGQRPPALGICGRCGGGDLHPIHHGKQTAYSAPRLTEETASLMTAARCDYPFLTRAASRNVSDNR